MNQIFLSLVFIILLLLNSSIFGAKKKDSINKENALMDYQVMFDAGTWKLYADKCGGKKHKKFLEDLAKLSWPDYKAYMASAAQYTSGGYYTDNCDNKDSQMLFDYYDWIISELQYLTNTSSPVKNEVTETKSNNNAIAEIDTIDEVENKLKKLKELYDKELISLSEYEDKKQEILDNF